MIEYKVQAWNETTGKYVEFIEYAYWDAQRLKVSLEAYECKAYVDTWIVPIPDSLLKFKD